MPVQNPLVLILDANNFAHYINHIPPGKTISFDIIRQLIFQLSSYVRSASQSIICELCLDYHHPDQSLPTLGGVLTFSADPPEEADDLLLHRFRYHYHQGRNCIIVTNDLEVCDKVYDEEGSYLLVNDFVRRPGNKPVFRDPIEFTPLIHRHKKVSVANTPRNLTKTDRAYPSPILTPIPIAEVELQAPLIIQTENDQVNLVTTPLVATPCPQPAYRLSLDTWPLDLGVRFLANSFCTQHGAEYRELTRSLNRQDLRPADLVELATALRNSCGSEPGFAARGSLLDRVRLALILSPDQFVSLSEIAKITRLNAIGLHGRIKRKAKGWLRIECTL